MRPPSIVMFDRLFLGSLVLGVIGVAIGFDQAVAALADDPTMRQVGLGAGFLIGIAAVGYGIYLLLWYLIARRRSKVAMWILIVLLALSLLSVPGMLAAPMSLFTIVNLVVYALEIAAVIYLFRPDAKAWMRGDAPADPATFD